MWLLLEYPSNILGYPSKYCNYTSKRNFWLFPHSQCPTPQWITFLIFILQKKLLNIKDVEFYLRMYFILNLFPFLWILNVQFTNFGFLNFRFFYFKNLQFWLTLIQNNHFYHWNFFITIFTYKIWME